MFLDFEHLNLSTLRENYGQDAYFSSVLDFVASFLVSDSFISYTYDLVIEVTTDKNQIKKFLEYETKNIKIIFTTYQSGKVTA